MSRRTQENIVVALLLAFFLAALVISLDYSPRARLVPVPICGLAIALLLFQLVWQNLRPADELNVDVLDVITARKGAADNSGSASEPPPEVKPSGLEILRRILIAHGFVALLVVLTLVAGPMPAIFVFTFAYFALSRQFSVARGLIYTAVFVAAVYVIFVQALQLQLYHGYLDPAVEYFRRL